MKDKKEVWDKPRPKDLGKPKELSSAEKRNAMRRAAKGLFLRGFTPIQAAHLWMTKASQPVWRWQPTHGVNPCRAAQHQQQGLPPRGAACWSATNCKRTEKYGLRKNSARRLAP